MHSILNVFRGVCVVVGSGRRRRREILVRVIIAIGPGLLDLWWRVCYFLDVRTLRGRGWEIFIPLFGSELSICPTS